MGIKQKIVRFVRKLAGTGYVTVEDIRRRGGVVGERCAIYTEKIDLAHAKMIWITGDLDLNGQVMSGNRIPASGKEKKRGCAING